MSSLLAFLLLFSAIAAIFIHCCFMLGSMATSLTNCSSTPNPVDMALDCYTSYLLNKDNWTLCTGNTGDECFPFDMYRKIIQGSGYNMSDGHDALIPQNTTDSTNHPEQTTTVYNGTTDVDNCTGSCLPKTTSVVVSICTGLGGFVIGCIVTCLVLNKSKLKKRALTCCSFKNRKGQLKLDVISADDGKQDTTTREALTDDTQNNGEDKVKDNNKYETLRREDAGNRGPEDLNRGSLHMYLDIDHPTPTPHEIYESVENLQTAGYIDMDKYKIDESNNDGPNAVEADESPEGGGYMTPTMEDIAEYLEPSAAERSGDLYANSQEALDDKVPESEPLIYENYRYRLQEY